MVRAVVIFPIHVSSNFDDFVELFETSQTDVNRNNEIIQILVEHPHVAWLGLKPCLFECDISVLRKALRCIFEKWILPIECFVETGNVHDNKLLQKDNFLNKSCITRHVRVPFLKNHRPEHKSVFVWIQPPRSDKLGYCWTGLLLRWENHLIRTQSLTGYYSTLGGGFFLCRHFHSAIVLARQQQQLAQVFRNDLMYYGCKINIVYSFIYSGKFYIARKLLRQIYNQISHSTPKAGRSLINMYQSAKLFCQRVRESNFTTKELETCSTITKTVDNNQRIRIVEYDQSKADDLIIPFCRLG
jgi:hypothetical protein